MSDPLYRADLPGQQSISGLPQIRAAVRAESATSQSVQRARPSIPTDQLLFQIPGQGVEILPLANGSEQSRAAVQQRAARVRTAGRLPRRDNVCPCGNSSADESPLLREERATFARCEPSAFDPKRTSELQTDNPQRRAIRRNGSADGRIVPLPFGGPSAWQHRFDDRRVECLVVMQANHVV